MTQQAIRAIDILTLGPPQTEIVLTGDIDLTVRDHTQDLIGQVREAGSVVYVDAGDVTFIDASGLRAVAELALCTGRRPVLSNAPPILRFLLRLTKLEESFTIVPGPQAAEPSASPQSR